MVFGGRASASCRRRSTRRRRSSTGASSRSIPQLAGYRIEYAWGGNVGFTFDRMPHVGRTKDGVAYALGCCGTGVALMTYLGTRVGEWLAGGDGARPQRALVPARPRPVRGPAVVPADRRGVVPPAGQAGGEVPPQGIVARTSATPSSDAPQEGDAVMTDHRGPVGGRPAAVGPRPQAARATEPRLLRADVRAGRGRRPRGRRPRCRLLRGGGGRGRRHGRRQGGRDRSAPGATSGKWRSSATGSGPRRSRRPRTCAAS